MDLQEAIENGMPLSLASTFATLTVVREALKLKESLATSRAWDCVRSRESLGITKAKLDLETGAVILDHVLVAHALVS